MSTFGKDTPMDRPNPGGRAAIFIASPAAEKPLLEALKGGSGMVGFGNKDGSVTIYFENNKFNDSSLAKWHSKVLKAYDRMVKLSPTVNKITLDSDNIIQVGFIEASGITVRKMDELKAWLTRMNDADSAPEQEYTQANL